MELASSDRHFLSRPRQFQLTLSTLAMFRKAELFRGLAAEAWVGRLGILARFCASQHSQGTSTMEGSGLVSACTTT